jgi:steroid 5-alpha reductase family enzyme
MINSYINATWIGTLGTYPVSWLQDPRFVAGVLVFAAGYFINRRSDKILRNLRKPGETGYKIPQGGLFRWVSAPNYFGELTIWTGWAIATWSLAGLSFAVFTAANLVPRALTNHKWYLDKFPDYPAKRRAIIPYIL